MSEWVLYRTNGLPRTPFREFGWTYYTAAGVRVEIPPPLHEATHISGGTDPFISTDVLEAVVKRLRETGGPTILAMAAVADGEYLKRSGTTIIGDTPDGGGGGSDYARSFLTMNG